MNNAHSLSITKISPPFHRQPPAVQHPPLALPLNNIQSSKHSFFNMKPSQHNQLRWHIVGNQHSRLFTHTRGHAFRLLANPNKDSGKDNFSKEVLMVDPLEAKEIAAKQLVQIKRKEKFKKRRQIEAINGAWAMIGLTAGLVIEGHTGKGILAQLDGYWHAILSFFLR